MSLESKVENCAKNIDYYVSSGQPFNYIYMLCATYGYDRKPAINFALDTYNWYKKDGVTQGVIRLSLYYLTKKIIGERNERR